MSSRGIKNVKLPFNSVVLDVFLLKYKLILIEWFLVDSHGYTLSRIKRYSPYNKNNLLVYCYVKADEQINNDSYYR